MNKPYIEMMTEKLNEGDLNGAMHVKADAFSYAAFISQLALEAFDPKDVAFAVAGIQLYLETMKSTLPEQEQERIKFLLKNTTAIIINKTALEEQQREQESDE